MLFNKTKVNCPQV